METSRFILESRCIWKIHSISAEAIYQWIYAEREDLTVELARRGKRRNPANKRGKRYLNPAAKKTSIAERPSVVTERSRFGDWEGDTIISRQSKFCIFTLVERKSRFTMLHLLPACNAQSALQALLEIFLPQLDRYPNQIQKLFPHLGDIKQSFRITA